MALPPNISSLVYPAESGCAALAAKPLQYWLQSLGRGLPCKGQKQGRKGATAQHQHHAGFEDGG